MKTVLVCGGGGFIGHHLARHLKHNGVKVICADLYHPEFSSVTNISDVFHVMDLRDYDNIKYLFKTYEIDQIYQLAADMGGAGYVFTGENDANIMHNSAQINLNILKGCEEFSVYNVFYSSSACIYPARNQLDPNNPNCHESSAYPADPDSEYGWEKLFSERLYENFRKNYGINIRIARFHNIFGPEGTYDGGKEKAPAALCRKVAAAKNGDSVEVWGDGQATRSFLYIDECIEGINRLVKSDYCKPINLGSEELISINDLAALIIGISGKDLTITNVPGPEGVRGRNSDNKLIKAVLNWQPSKSLFTGLEETYSWVNKQVNNV